MASTPTEPTPTPPQPSTKPFRFKHRSPHSPSQRRRSASPPITTYQSRHRHHRHHHRSRRRPETPPNEPTPSDPANPSNPHSPQYLHPDTAFRESLFDALADDEGAAFWEGVYGQPIHTYSPYTAKPDSGDEDEAGNPKLERMSDEEYVRYVRGKMWEKSHGYIVEERRRREEERQRKRVVEEEGRRWRDGVEEALRRGEERRSRGRWRGVWERYVEGWEGLRFDVEGWEGLRFDVEGDGGKEMVRDRIVWPVESGSWKDVGREGVERFYGHAPQAGGTVVDLGDMLKKERVKWHPDKMQQRAGSEGIDEDTMKVVTAVFQVVDRIWSEKKGMA